MDARLRKKFDINRDERRGKRRGTCRVISNWYHTSLDSYFDPRSRVQYITTPKSAVNNDSLPQFSLMWIKQQYIREICDNKFQNIFVK